MSHTFLASYVDHPYLFYCKLPPLKINIHCPVTGCTHYTVNLLHICTRMHTQTHIHTHMHTHTCTHTHTHRWEDSIKRAMLMGPQDTSVSPDLPVSPVEDEVLLGLSAMTMHLNPRGGPSTTVHAYYISMRNQSL